jgi:putative transposase
MRQIARNAIDESSGHLRQVRYVLHDRDTKFCAAFQATLATAGVQCVALPPRSPNLNAFAERWIRSVKEECLSKLILFGERALQRAATEFIEHFLAERNHQGKGNVLLFHRATSSSDQTGVHAYSAEGAWRPTQLLLFTRSMNIVAIRERREATLKLVTTLMALLGR